MKIEKLNDRQIRCTLNKQDLDDRQLRLSELAYGSEKAKALFREMMQQAYNDFGFEAEDIPLMIEAIPVSGDCLVLVVTKVDSPEELDTRFSKFTSGLNHDDDSEDEDYELTKDAPLDDLADSSVPDNSSDENDSVASIKATRESIKNYFGQISDLIEKVSAQTGKSFIPLGAAVSNPPDNGRNNDKTGNADSGNATDNDLSDSKANTPANKSSKKKNSGKSDSKGEEQGKSTKNSSAMKLPEYRLFHFDSLENIIKACNNVSPYFTGHSVIYKMPERSSYLLLFYSDSMESTVYNRLCSILNEYGILERSSYATVAFLNEHMDLILDENAVQTMARL